MATFGKTTVGGSWNGNGLDTKDVNKYNLPVAASVTKLTVYCRGEAGGPQVRKGVIYADAAGQPDVLKGTTAEVSIGQNQAAGWVDMTFASPINLAAGDYWIGAAYGATGSGSSTAYDNGSSGDYKYNVDWYGDSPADPFGTPSNDVPLMSIYATYTTAGGPISATAGRSWQS
jgi:hypothetical protein